MIILYEFVDFIKVIRVNVRSLCQSAFRQIRQRVALCQYLSWRLCRRGAVLDNRTDPLA